MEAMSGDSKGKKYPEGPRDRDTDVINERLQHPDQERQKNITRLNTTNQQT